MEKRLKKLLEAGVVSALVCMVKQESPALTDACRECIARWESRRGGDLFQIAFLYAKFNLLFFYGRVFLALVEKQEDRGTVVAQGGGKVWHKTVLRLT